MVLEDPSRIPAALGLRNFSRDAFDFAQLVCHSYLRRKEATVAKQTKFRGTENKPMMHAMNGLRRSSAAQPQESRNKRARTKQTVLRRELAYAA